MSLPAPPDELAALSERLGGRITASIERDGPIPFDRYMSLALYEPGLGYYVNGLHKFGGGGDFVTAPEQGGLFAAGVARQCDQVAATLGDEWTLFELGAGSGALPRALLEKLTRPPSRYLILEPSATPETPFQGVILANEVIDALPVARFEIGDGEPLEQCVGIHGDRLAWTTRRPRERVRRAVESLQRELPEPMRAGYASEISIDLPGWISTVTEPLSRGLALFIDYGYPRAEFYHPDRSGGTLVCHYRHRAHFDPFTWPGLTDISAFVDFTAVAEAGHDAGLEVAGFTSQAGFLLSLGAHELVEQAADERQHLALAGELKRLTLPAEMGEKFKVIGLTRNFDEPLTGFELMSQIDRL
ncbi:MAG: SAM-dependent methyltransferase [Gammaproteobacteria bacterium]|jgi:SAM-dependent MidA family methyltransferase|nr:SAM-dependent methyltransferase [Gammaproteobacteria bacterium]